MRVFKRDMLVESSIRKLLLEAEDDDLFGSGDEGGDEEGGEDEGGDEEAGDEAAGEDEEPADEKEGDAEGEEKPKSPPIKPGDKAALEKQFDEKLDTMLQDFEVSALKSAKINSPENANDVKKEGWWRAPMSKLLFEADKEYTESDFDIQKFASDIARLIMNYDTLLDMESIIYNKAKSFLELKYGKDVSDSMSEILATRYGLDFEGKSDDYTPAPLAVGARSGGGGAG